MRIPVQTPNLSASTWATLVVEDYAPLRDLMRRMLEKAAFEVRVACDAEEALALAKNQTDRIDVVVSDVMMPGMDGFELAARLTAIHPTARVLFLTGYAEHSPFVRNRLRLGDAFLEKPFSQGDLIDTILGLIAGPPLRLVKGDQTPPCRSRTSPGARHGWLLPTPEAKVPSD